MRSGISALAIMVLTSVAGAQIGSSQDGRALDSNYQVGSSGTNYAVGTYTPPGSQLYISGQVRGLGSFHGNTGYYAPDQLNLRLPGAAISDFIQQSVGVSDVLRGNAYMITPYFDPARTVGSAADFTTGRIQPGRTAPTPGVSGVGLAQRLYIDAKQDYSDVEKATATGKSGLGLVDTRVMGGIKGDSVSVFSSPLQSLRTDLSAPFDVNSSGDRFELAREFYRQNDQLSDSNRRVDSAIDALVNTRRDLRTDRRAGEEFNPATPDELEQYADKTGRRPTPGKTPSGKPGETTAGKNAADTAVAGQDVFFDLLLNIQKKRAIDTAVKPPEEKIEIGQEEEPIVPRTKDMHGVEMKDNIIIVHGLSGRGRDLYNAYLAKAEKLSLSGKYYSAVREFENADMIDPANPLARVGMSMSYLAAGEPLTAANYLYDAIAIFPPLMEVRLDLDTMLEKTAQEESLAELEKLIAQKGDEVEPTILMLAAFANFSAGRDDQAKKYAVAIDKRADALPLMKTYAAYIITGKSQAKPSPVKALSSPTSAPTTAPVPPTGDAATKPANP